MKRHCHSNISLRVGSTLVSMPLITTMNVSFELINWTISLDSIFFVIVISLLNNSLNINQNELKPDLERCRSKRSELVMVPSPQKNGPILITYGPQRYVHHDTDSFFRCRRMNLWTRIWDNIRSRFAKCNSRSSFLRPNQSNQLEGGFKLICSRIQGVH